MTTLINKVFSSQSILYIACRLIWEYRMYMYTQWGKQYRFTYNVRVKLQVRLEFYSVRCAATLCMQLRKCSIFVIHFFMNDKVKSLVKYSKIHDKISQCFREFLDFSVTSEGMDFPDSRIRASLQLFYKSSLEMFRALGLLNFSGQSDRGDRCQL